MIREVRAGVTANPRGDMQFYTAKENHYRREVYAKALNMCCMPGCEHGYNLHVHHIIPVKRGGTDDYTNFICLCEYCHYHSRLHRRSEDKLLDLLVYKFYIEKLELGFTSDDMSNEEFQLRLGKLGKQG
jgi:hypothetical protein